MTHRDAEACYAAIIAAWNAGDAVGFAGQFAEDGDIIGYDGSPANGRAEIEAYLTAIFRDHKPGRFVTIIRGSRALNADAALVRAVVGIVPHGRDDIEPAVNFLQTLTAIRTPVGWRAAMLQATPAQFHARPETAEQLTAELRQAAKSG